MIFNFYLMKNLVLLSESKKYAWHTFDKLFQKQSPLHHKAPCPLGQFLQDDALWAPQFTEPSKN